MVQRNLVNLILISILAMAVENRCISRLNVPTMKSKKRDKMSSSNARPRCMTRFHAVKTGYMRCLFATVKS